MKEKDKVYEVAYSYSVYDGEMWGYGGEETFKKGFFTTLEKAKDVANSKELVDEVVKAIYKADYDHTIQVFIFEHTLDEIEEYGKNVYDYSVYERPTQEEGEYGKIITQIILVENDKEIEIGQGTGWLSSFKDYESEDEAQPLLFRDRITPVNEGVSLNLNKKRR